MVKNGITEDNLRKLFTHAKIGEKEQDMVRNLNQLGINITADVSEPIEKRISCVVLTVCV